MAWWGFNTIFAYLNDFLIIDNTRDECELAYNELINLLSELGFIINWEKALGPTHQLTFLGIEIDIVLRQLCLTESKVCKLSELFSNTLIRQSITKQDLGSLVGKLSSITKMVFGGRTFLWCINDINMFMVVQAIKTHRTPKRVGSYLVSDKPVYQD